MKSEIFLVFNIVLVSYRDLNSQNANKMKLIQGFAIISTSNILQYAVYSLRTINLRNTQYKL